MTEYLSGKLLLSAPSLRDPNFLRTVIYLCRHDEEGAFGLVLNRPTGMLVADALPVLMGTPLGSLSLLQGGPVQTESVFILHDSPVAGGESATPGLHHGGDSDLLERLVALSDEEPAPRTRLYAGYSGWSGGQLEGELERHSWIVAPATPDLVLEARGQEAWAAVLRGLGGRYALMADAPLDADWN